MSDTRFRFDPDPSYHEGSEVFRTRGVAYVEALAYVDKRVEGGRARLIEAAGGDRRLASYLDQLFIVAGEYDTTPLVRVYVALAKLRGETPWAFVEGRAKKSAATMVQGMWKRMLKTESPEVMAERVHLAFNRYFAPTHAATVAVTPGRLEGEIAKMAAPFAGFYASSTSGFVVGALALTGAEDARVEWRDPVADGSLGGVELLRARFVATFRAASGEA